MIELEDGIRRKIRTAEIEAKFALVVTLGVCLWTEWGHGSRAIAMAVVFPIAGAFSVDGLNNASGLGRLQFVYVPIRLFGLLAFLAYSYSHYYAMFPTEGLLIGGLDIRPVAALVFESLTITALIARRGHSQRLDQVLATDVPAEPGETITPSDPNPSAGISHGDRSADDFELPSTGSGFGPLIAQPGIGLALNGAGNNNNGNH